MMQKVTKRFPSRRSGSDALDVEQMAMIQVIERISSLTEKIFFMTDAVISRFGRSKVTDKLISQNVGHPPTRVSAFLL